MRIPACAFLAMVMVSSSARAQTTAPAAPQAASVPTAPMPEAVYQILKSAVADHRYNDNANKTANLTALEVIKRTGPDYSKLRLVRVYSTTNVSIGLAWCIRLTADEMTYLSWEHAAVTLDRKKVGKIEDADAAAAADAMIRYLKDRANGDWHPEEFSFIDNDGPNGAPRTAGARFLDQAVAAAWQGWNGRATALVDGALFSGERALVNAIDSQAWPSYSKGIEMLKTGAPREKMREVFAQTVALAAGGSKEAELRDLIAQLEVEIAADAQYAKAAQPNPTTLPAEAQVQFYISQFADIDAQQFSNPGEPWVLNTVPAAALVKIGRPALPALIALLDDRRITRSVGYLRTYNNNPQVLRYQDIAIKCIQSILDMHFYSRSSSGSFLSNEPKEIHDAVVADVRAWWKAHGQESEVKGQIARLDSGTIYERIETLHKVEKLDPTAVNAIIVLRAWAVAARDDDAARHEEQRGKPWHYTYSDLPAIAEEMAVHHNLDMLAEMRRMASGTDLGYLGALVYLAHWGTAEDFQFLRMRLRKAVATERPDHPTDEAQVILDVGAEVKISTSPLAVPVMVECLAYRQRNGLLGTPQGGVSFGIADECMENLIKLTSHDEGFVFTASPAARDLAFDKWLAWWKAQGQDAYVAANPEVEKVLAPIQPPGGPSL